MSNAVLSDGRKEAGGNKSYLANASVMRHLCYRLLSEESLIKGEVTFSTAVISVILFYSGTATLGARKRPAKGSVPGSATRTTTFRPTCAISSTATAWARGATRPRGTKCCGDSWSRRIRRRRGSCFTDSVQWLLGAPNRQTCGNGGNFD